MAKDNSGHIYLNGYYAGTLNFKGVSYPNNGGSDSFVVKINASTREVVWLKTFGGTSSDYPNGLVVNEDDEVFFSMGISSATVMIDGFTVNKTAGVNDEIVLMKLDSRGTAMWVKQVTSTSAGSRVYANGLGIDSDGNAYLAGYSNGTLLNLGGGNTQARIAGKEGFFAKYSGSTGDVIWHKFVGGIGLDDQILNITVDKNDNIIVAGLFQASVDRGDGTLLTSSNYDILMQKYNKAGVHQWSQTFPAAAGFVWPTTLITDSSGNVLLGLGFENDILVGGVTYTAADDASHLFGKFSGTDGSSIWAKQLDVIGDYDWGLSLQVDQSGNIYVLGESDNSLDLGGTIITPSAGKEAIYLAKYDASGDLIWGRSWEGIAAGTGNGYYSDNMFLVLDDGRLVFHGWYKTEMELAGEKLNAAGTDWAGFVAFIDEDGQDHL